MYRKMVKQFMKKISKQEIQYDFCLICLWSHQVFVNPLYHFVRKALNSVTSEIIEEKLYSFNPNISINNKESSLLRYQIKYPCAPALLVLAAVLEKKYSVNVISLDVEKKKLNSDDWLTIAIREISKKTKYGIMISFVSTELTQLYNFTELIKKEKKELKIIVGGVHATYNDFQLMQNFNIDYIIRGEGELTTLELCDAIVTNKDVKNIQGITYRHNGKIIRNADRNFIDLKDTPIPAYHYIKDYINEVVISTMFSRGCPYKCDYCTESAFWSSKVRYKDITKFVDELDILINKYNQHFIHIADSTFGTDKKRLSLLCDELEKRKFNAFFSVNIRPNVFKYMGEKLLIRLKNLNFVEFYMGIESADENIVETLNRYQGEENLIETLRRLKKIGIPFVKLYLMLGSPAENRNSLEKTVTLIEELLEEDLIFYATGKYFVPSVGSMLYNKIGFNDNIIPESIRLDRYNSPPIYVANNEIAEELDIYMQMIQVIQYKHYLNKCDINTQKEMKKEWEEFVSKNYCQGYYF